MSDNSTDDAIFIPCPENDKAQKNMDKVNDSANYSVVNVEDCSFDSLNDEVDDEPVHYPEGYFIFPGHCRPQGEPKLPGTVTKLETEAGSTVYLVGTAHFSEESNADVAQTIQATKPDVVMVELCTNRVNILKYDAETLLENAKDINLQKIRYTMKQQGLVQGALHVLLLVMSAHLTKELGMAPGGEFRTAFKEAKKVPGCRVHLGDRPIQITLQRAIAALTPWQKIKLGIQMLSSCRETITKEEVERYKQKDILEEVLAEMTGEFPVLSEVFVKERDAVLAHALRVAADPANGTPCEMGMMPTVVVGVVGIGHVAGIVRCWNEEPDADIWPLMQIPKSTSRVRIVMKWSVRLSLLGLAAWGAVKLARMTPLRRFL